MHQLLKFELYLPCMIYSPSPSVKETHTYKSTSDENIQPKQQKRNKFTFALYIYELLMVNERHFFSDPKRTNKNK